METYDSLLPLFMSVDFGLNCLGTYALVHTARANLLPFFPGRARKWAKLGIDILNLCVGALLGVLLGYDPRTVTNILIGVVASLFSHQMYGIFKRHLPGRFGGEKEQEEREDR